MSYSLVIFDFDGTLADSADLFLQALEQIAPQHGFRAPDPAQLEQYRALEPRALLRELGLPLWKLPRVAIAMRRAMAAQIDAIRLFDGAAALLLALRRHGIRTAVVSSNSQHNVEQVLGLKYASMIDHFGCGASLLGKARKLREVLAAFDLAHNRVLCVGDEIRDAQAAAGVGLDFVGVAWGFASAEALAPHSCRAPLQDFEQLRALVLDPG